MAKIAVIGTGYVGLVTGACFADAGNDVICVDKNPQVVDKLNNGHIHIYEPGLSEIVARCRDRSATHDDREKRLTFTTDTAWAVAHSDIIFIAVGTPSLDDGSADLSAVRAVASAIGSAMNGYKIIVTKSTVPVGTGGIVNELIGEVYKEEFDVVSNPEFLKEGTAIEDFTKPDRVVIGIPDDVARKDFVVKTFDELYHPFSHLTQKVMYMSRPSAELTKYAANAMLATRISFMNEVAQLAEKVGADVDDIRKGIGTDKRIGRAFLYAGPGYGGSCFPKDTSELATTGNKFGVSMRLTDAAQDTNKQQRTFCLEKIKSYFDGDVAGKTFMFWGLAFKARTDDVRYSPAIDVASALVDLGAQVIAFDPEAVETTRAVIGDKISYADNQYGFSADALVIMTDWNAFKSPDFDQLSVPVIFDMRNMFSLSSMRGRGFDYISIGRPSVLRN